MRRILYAGRGTVNAAAYDPASTRIVTADGDGTARIFSAATGKRLALLRHSGAVTDAAFSPDGQIVATLCDGDVVTCRPADETARFVRLSPHHFHHILKAKFGLNDR